MRADLPREMEAEVARQLEYVLPPTRSRVSFRRRISTQNIPIDPSIEEESLEDDEDVFGSPGEFVANSVREEQLFNEELEDAYDHFLDKLEKLVHMFKFNLTFHIFRYSLFRLSFPNTLYFSNRMLRI